MPYFGHLYDPSKARFTRVLPGKMSIQQNPAAAGKRRISGAPLLDLPLVQLYILLGDSLRATLRVYARFPSSASPPTNHDRTVYPSPNPSLTKDINKTSSQLRASRHPPAPPGGDQAAYFQLLLFPSSKLFPGFPPPVCPALKSPPDLWRLDLT